MPLALLVLRSRLSVCVRAAVWLALALLLTCFAPCEGAPLPPSSGRGRGGRRRFKSSSSSESGSDEDDDVPIALLRAVSTGYDALGTIWAQERKLHGRKSRSSWFGSKNRRKIT